MITNEVYMEIEVLRQHGFSLRRIAVEVGCAVNTVRSHLATGTKPKYERQKVRSEVAADLKRIYTCSTVDEAERRLAEFEDKWDGSYLPISQSWRRNWSRSFRSSTIRRRSGK